MSSRPASESGRPPRAGRRTRRVVVGALAVLALAATGMVLAAFFIVQDGKATLANAKKPASIQLIEGATSPDGGATVEYEGRRYALNEHMSTVCFLGFDREGPTSAPGDAGQADAVIVAALNLEFNQIKLISIPRESMVDVRVNPQGDGHAETQTMALCLAYAFGDGGASSCENTIRSVSDALYGMPVCAYLALDLGGIVPLNDAVGGVPVRALETIPETGIVEGGETLLLGQDARSYVQWRNEAVLESPLQRQARQTQYVKAYAARLLERTAQDPGTIPAVYEAVTKHAVTDLSASELAYLAFALASTGTAHLKTTTLSGEMRHGESYGEFHFDQASVYETVLDTYYHRID